MSGLATRRLSARAAAAFALANIRYWRTVATQVRAQLHRWERRAAAIPQPDLRALALRRLREVSLNAEVGAMFATLSPRRHRAPTTEAIVALQVLFDYLDGLGERPSRRPLGDGRELHAALADAVAPWRDLGGGNYYAERAGVDDGAYLSELVRATRAALAQLPAITVVAPVLEHSAERCAEAQVRAHAAASLGPAQAVEWARAQAESAGLQWRQFLAGAGSSVIAIDALIAAATDPLTTRTEAIAIDDAYLCICGLATMLDSLVDFQSDQRTGKLQLGYMQYYEGRDHLARELETTLRVAAGRAAGLRHDAHHFVTLVGVVAYYTSQADRRNAFARPVAVQLHRELRPLITPVLALLWLWRNAGLAQQHAKRVPRSTQAEPAPVAPASFTAAGRACASSEAARGLKELAGQMRRAEALTAGDGECGC